MVGGKPVTGHEKFRVAFHSMLSVGVSDEPDNTFDCNKREYPKRIQRLRSTPGEQLAKEVDFFGMTKGPSIWFLGLGNNHGVHHRGQLMAYLRAMGSKVPSIYGGSADEPFQGA